MVEKNDFKLSAQDYRCYEHLSVVVNMNNSGCELKSPDTMNYLGYGWYEWLWVVSSGL